MSQETENPTSRQDRPRRWLKRLGWTAAWVVTLLVLAYAVENWLGARAWRAYVAEARAAGEKLAPEAVIPPPIPEEDNFAAIPLFKPLFDYERVAPSGDSPFGTLKWRDPAAKERLEKLHPFGRGGV